jgi:alpha-tubulin suppressor-like RCC1 family protein
VSAATTKAIFMAKQCRSCFVECYVGGVTPCVILQNGAVKCWGDNAYGELGQGDIAARGDQPGEMGELLQAVDIGPVR